MSKEALKPCPESLFKSYCPKHKRTGHDQTGFRCICAELEVAYISGGTENRYADDSNVPDGEKDRLEWALGEADAPGAVPYRIKMALKVLAETIRALSSPPARQEKPCQGKPSNLGPEAGPPGPCYNAEPCALHPRTPPAPSSEVARAEREALENAKSGLLCALKYAKKMDGHHSLFIRMKLNEVDAALSAKEAA